MHILILGGGGFIGSRLARELSRRRSLNNQKIDRVTLVDKGFPEALLNDKKFNCIVGDFSDQQIIDPIIQLKPDIIFHLAAVVSGEAEKNFELGMSVNFHGTLQMLELCRQLGYHPRIVFASSCAVFGGDVSQIITDTTGPKPLSSYGTQKAMVELLMSDYSRKGFVDARSLRLPTIAVRSGKPNAATSSFVSSIIREPLNGLGATYPVPAETRVWIQSPNCVVQNFIHASELDGKILKNDRVINLPGLTVSIKEMIGSLEKLTSPKVTSLIKYTPDEFIQSIVLNWPPHFDTATANRLGFVHDHSIDEVIQQYIQDESIKF